MEPLNCWTAASVITTHLHARGVEVGGLCGDADEMTDFEMTLDGERFLVTVTPLDTAN